MKDPIDPRAFEFLEEFASLIRSGSVERWDALRVHSVPVAFCDAVFMQLFKSLGCEISGFTDRSVERLGSFAAKSRSESPDDPEQIAIRRLTSKFDDFCDIHNRIEGAGYGPGFARVDYEAVHEYLPELFAALGSWVELSRERQGVDTALRQAVATYNTAIEESNWLTRQPQSKSGLLSWILGKRTS